ncbi:hypothetical protein BJ875DRAFT_217412 [Amylocarpus encephaloides]|uniref:Uncharacterized protein n=1 Tax=Amylocarpus encephaloides TaxID=45428 RepID=A0A9P7YMJ5_9HELO|nr:hypothetical protein BJ875DRAFT_217412 [Amylocarpus encephaloides]
MAVLGLLPPCSAATARSALGDDIERCAASMRQWERIATLSMSSKWCSSPTRCREFLQAVRISQYFTRLSFPFVPFSETGSCCGVPTSYIEQYTGTIRYIHTRTVAEFCTSPAQRRRLLLSLWRIAAQLVTKQGPERTRLGNIFPSVCSGLSAVETADSPS